MTDMTEQGHRQVADIAARHQVSEQAVTDLMHALQAGHGTAAQFNIRELGGMGQWSQGGMTQIGDMFNDGLKQTVNALCVDLAKLLGDRTVFAENSGQQTHRPNGSSWWPADLGNPDSTGGQNDMQYAVFSGRHRLAVKQGGSVSVYDTGDHAISGFSQSQSGGTQTLTFSAGAGRISTDDLRKIG